MIVTPPTHTRLLGWQERADALPLGVGQAGRRNLGALQRRRGGGRSPVALTLTPGNVAALGHRLMGPPEARPAQCEGLGIRVRRAHQQQAAHFGDGQGD